MFRLLVQWVDTVSLLKKVDKKLLGHPITVNIDSQVKVNVFIYVIPDQPP